jgi:pimeloyl-ACP methyl ester carboxylesterase
MHVSSQGRGKDLLLVHGLGSHSHSWRLIAPALERERHLLMVDLPGHGRTPAEEDSGTFTGQARSLAGFLRAEGMEGVDMVGTSLGGQLVLEMARRGLAGSVVALSPGGFWMGWERLYMESSMLLSSRLLRTLGPSLPLFCANLAGRSTLLAQLSAHPWELPADLVAEELESYACTPVLEPLTVNLAHRPMQEGPAAPGTGRLAIGWGRRDGLCLPQQAVRAAAAFPGARLAWFEDCGHFPAWDRPAETARLILETVGPTPQVV